MFRFSLFFALLGALAMPVGCAPEPPPPPPDRPSRWTGANDDLFGVVRVPPEGGLERTPILGLLRGVRLRAMGGGVADAGPWSFGWRYDAVGPARSVEWVAKQVADVMTRLPAYVEAEGGGGPGCGSLGLRIVTLPEHIAFDPERFFPSNFPYLGLFSPNGESNAEDLIVLVGDQPTERTFAHELAHYAWSRTCQKPRLDTEPFAQGFEDWRLPASTLPDLTPEVAGATIFVPSRESGERRRRRDRRRR